MHARFIAAALMLSVGTVSVMAAGTVLSPAQIKTLFGTGKPFTAVPRSGGKAYWFTFKPDGSALEVPKGTNQTGATGTWDLSAKGYCSKWGGSRAHCYTVDKNGDQYEVRDRVGYLVSRWTP